MSDQINYDEISERIINEIVKISFGQFARKIETGAEDVAKLVVDELREKSLHAILETIVFYRSISKDEGFLFPDGTRFLFNRGSSKIVAIEQKPQVRSLTLDESLWGERRDQRGDNQIFNLAFPYVVFVAIVGEATERLYVYFRNKPLKSLSSNLYMAVFPNLGGCGDVCRSERTYSTGDPMNVKIETLISDFWQSCFNSDLDEYWRGRTDIDNRLDLNVWKLQSQLKPMFPCEINWTKKCTLGEAMEMSSLDNDDQVSATDQQVSTKLKGLLNEAADEVSEKLNQYLSAERLERYCPRSVKKDLTVLVESMCGDMEALIRRLVLELGTARERIERQSEEVTWETQPGGLW
jgi:hypothetical protein